MGLRYDPQAVAFLRSTAPTVRRRLKAALDALSKDARASGLDIRQLQGAEEGKPVYRLRVGDYRIAFVIEERHTRVIRIFHRRDGYGWLERLA